MNDIIDSNYLGRIYQGYWRHGILRYLSTTQTGIEFTDSHISDDWTAYLEEFEKLGNSVLIEPTTDVIEQPYPSKLRPLQRMDFLRTAKNIMIVNYRFYAIDSTKIGSVHQNADVNTAITNSVTSQPVDAYVASRFLNTIPVSWQPNYFRPKIKINNNNILQNQENTAYGDFNNKGDLSIGGFVPDNRNIYYFQPVVNNIDVYASVRQIVKVGTDYYAKAFPVLCELNITFQE